MELDRQSPLALGAIIAYNFGTFDNRIKGRRFLLPFRNNSRQDFTTVGKLQDPAAARLIFVPVAALGAEGCCLKLSKLLHQ